MFGIAVALTLVIGGEPVGPRKVLWASVGYSVFIEALFSGIGMAIGDIL